MIKKAQASSVVPTVSRSVEQMQKCGFEWVFSLFLSVLLSLCFSLCFSVLRSSLVSSASVFLKYACTHTRTHTHTHYHKFMHFWWPFCTGTGFCTCIDNKMSHTRCSDFRLNWLSEQPLRFGVISTQEGPVSLQERQKLLKQEETSCTNKKYERNWESGLHKNTHTHTHTHNMGVLF